jgi:hypothetical protein
VRAEFVHGFNKYILGKRNYNLTMFFLNLNFIFILGKRNYNLTSEKDLRTMCRQCGLPDKARVLKSTLSKGIHTHPPPPPLNREKTLNV